MNEGCGDGFLEAGETGKTSVQRRIGLARASSENGAVLLLEDFRNALIAYTRLSTFEREKPTYPAFATIELAEGAASANKPPEAAEGTSFDVIVLALELPAPACRKPLADTLRALSQSDAIKPDACVYAIICDPSTDSGSSATATDKAARACKQAGAHWCGAVVVTDAPLIPRLVRAPRLGMWRRPVSKAIDRLVAAVRMGCALNELDALLGVDPDRANTDNVIVASPHPIWRFFNRG